MSVRDFLNKGIHIADVSVASGSIPEAAPSLASSGYSVVRASGSGTNIVLPFIVVWFDLVGGTAPTATANLWGYAEPPAAGAELVSDWQIIDTVTVSDSGPTVALIPVLGFSRFAIQITSTTGTPTSVKERLVGASSSAASVFTALGMTAGSGSSSSGYDAVLGAWKTAEQAGSDTKHVETTLADENPGTDGTHYYYLDMDGFSGFGCQLSLNGGSGTVTVTVEGTMQDDGTVQASCTYQDITISLTGSSSIVAPSATPVNDMIIDNGNITGYMKYVRIKVVAASGSNDGVWILYNKKKF